MDEQLAELKRRLSNDADSDVTAELIPAATVILLRDGEQGLETLMLRKNSKIAFAGMWVFPGGRIDAGDGDDEDTMESRARRAAVREAQEECGLCVEPQRMAWFSHWTPPALGNRRFSTWFFAAPAPAGEVCVDQGEITESQWITPAEALARHSRGEIELVPPTYVTLHYLSAHCTVDEALAALDRQTPRYYATRIARSGDDLVAMWTGDAGYETSDPDVPGARHRLQMGAGGFRFDDSGAEEPAAS